MEMRFTEQQQKVIDLRKRNLLVSAAAGSGKTAVLVERILARITDKEDPIDIDRLLIVTFTNAAASEMRERIGAAIEKRLLASPEDVHLQRQQTLLYNAQITTIHSFCLFVIRNYFHRISLEPDFRIGEEGELKLLRGDVLDEQLEVCYQRGDPEFLQLAETLATGKNDEKLKETVETLYGFAMSDPWPRQWLLDCRKLYVPQTLEEFQESPVGHALGEYLRAVTGQWAGMYDICIQVSQEPDGPQVYGEFLEQEREQFLRCARCESYGDYSETLAGIRFGRMPAARKYSGDESKKQYVQELRKSVKESHKKLMEQFFFLPPEEMVAMLAKNQGLVEALTGLTLDFMDAFGEKKREKNLLDFHDLEHLALEILVDFATEEPSQTALELRTQYEEVMVDEYQDSNFVQEAILQAVAGTDNRFMVGDVKQSIYRFRMARPELFMEKYDSYTVEDGPNQKIDLHRNFRSRREVLDAVNALFYGVMGRDLGNVEYDEAAALYPGKEFPKGEAKDLFQTEILLADPEEFAEVSGQELGEGSLTASQLEAAVIATRIQEMRQCLQVTDKATGQLRPVEYSDMVILLRGIGVYGQQLVETLKDWGIPVILTGSTGYFSAVEVQTILNFLRILDNPRQDIPMAAVLKSQIGGFSEEELARMVIAFRNQPFYQAFFSYEKQGQDQELREKCSRFLRMLEGFRQRIPDTPIHELLYQMMDETGYLDYVSALPGGSVRRANLEMLVEKAVAYESTSYHGLFHFTRYIGRLQTYEVDFGEAEETGVENAVRLMTIHKSKGLEFPVVFVAGIGRLMNQQDVRSRMVLHPRYGIGLDIMDLERRVRMPSLGRQVLARQIQMENAGEELRVLYVALTRAKEKLVLTGTLKKAREKMDACDCRRRYGEKRLGFLERLQARTYLDWILPVLAGREECHIRCLSPVDLGRRQAKEQLRQAFTRKWLLDRAEDCRADILEEIENRFRWQYPYEEEQDVKANLTVSELKHRVMDQLRQEAQDTEYVFSEPEVIPYIPAFIQERQEENLGALRGTAMHRVLECLDFSRPFDSLREQVEEMRERGLLEEQLYRLVSFSGIQRFLDSELAARMQRAAREGKLYREKPFVMGKDRQGQGAMILIQGIMDAFFEEEGEMVLLDYKTDGVKTPQELIDRYGIQMDLYQEALEKATGKRVKEKLLYSFRLRKAIGLPCGVKP